MITKNRFDFDSVQQRYEGFERESVIELVKDYLKVALSTYMDDFINGLMKKDWIQMMKPTYQLRVQYVNAKYLSDQATELYEMFRSHGRYTLRADQAWPDQFAFKEVIFTKEEENKALDISIIIVEEMMILKTDILKFLNNEYILAESIPDYEQELGQIRSHVENLKSNNISQRSLK